MKRGENQDYTINYNTGKLLLRVSDRFLKQNFITISYNYTKPKFTTVLS